MPKSAKLDDTNKVHQDTSAPAEQPVRAGSNGYNATQLQGYVDRIRSCQSEIDAIMANAQDACAPHRDDIAAIKKEAAEAGFSKTEFATVLRKLRLEDKLEAVDAKLDEEQKTNYELMIEALDGLAGTPLGDAAAAAH